MVIKRESDVQLVKRVDVERIKYNCIKQAKDIYNGLTGSQSEYLAGMGAACLATTLTYPINKVIFRQSLWGLDYEKALRQLRIEGFGKLFRGCMPPVITKSINASVMFGAYHDYYNNIRDGYIGQQLLSGNEVSMKFWAGMASGTTEAFLMPLERVQMLLQDGRLNNRYRNTVHAIYSLRQYGIREYYRGLTAVLLRNGPATFLYFGLQPGLKNLMSGDTLDSLSVQSNTETMRPITEVREFVSQFASGAMLGAVISTIAFPLNVIRIHMQTQEIGSVHHSTWTTLMRLCREPDGRKRLISGIHMNAFRSVLYWGCITVFSESLRQYCHTKRF